jgi:hypothetical protein
MATEMQEELLTLVREMDSREGAIIAWEEGFTTFACALTEVCMEHDASRSRADAVSRTSSPRHVPPVPGPNSSPTDMEVREAILAEELESVSHPPTGGTCRQSWTRPVHARTGSLASISPRLRDYRGRS